MRVLLAASVLAYCCRMPPKAVGFSPQSTRRRDAQVTVPSRRIMSRRHLQTGSDSTPQISNDASRRSAIASIASIFVAGSILDPSLLTSGRPTSIARSSSDDDFQGTSLPLLSLDDAYQYALSVQTTGESPGIFPCAQYPDPLLRRPASRIPIPANPDEQASLLTKIQAIAQTLARTAQTKKAVGLAAQQCGIDVSLVYLQTKKGQAKNSDGGIFLLNPRIVDRSPEEDMRIWNEECLVLPPSFRATLLRDAVVTVEYETIFTNSRRKDYLSTQQITLQGELARAAQHEMQHDEGLLIVDHVDLAELPPFMQEIESDHHRKRMQRAFSRELTPSSIILSPEKLVVLDQDDENSNWPFFSVPRANAADTGECDEACLAERKKRNEERRAMMRQSRTNTNRQDMSALSQQRAALYNTTYQGAKCPPNVPCI